MAAINGSPRARRVVSLLKPADVEALGTLPQLAICGEYVGYDSSEVSFRPNPEFVDFMHRVIAEVAPNDPGFIAAAKSQGEGWLYIIDQRTPEGTHGRVPPEDIVGAFKVEQGEVMPESYNPSPNYKVLTRHGLPRLPLVLNAALIAALKASGKP
jgi:hypothetical protein